MEEEVPGFYGESGKKENKLSRPHRK
ncbi:regulator of chromosome condensation (RCC1) and BTB (POZ) domain containing protein 2, isoform CRA_a [Rattus norvegicus]|uniref:Regulator of chromosome condensation (RCC1) and BTB (POZ) domain containing protein 2, isoform CRA_a n=1 Tax=Rattus norvegicus TaxID=10116 RepID=A6HTQ2_RAT|nr:regulator of chromosome condensation (RCC1) and BTB (POZ) domain containing protein 2, isoform CRA_a [Rattus norvegicus]